MVTTVICWAVFGLVVAGAIARVIHPGFDSMGYAGTILLGISGSLLGGGVAYLLGYGTSPTQGAGWVLSVIGAVVLLSVGGYMRRTRRTV